MPIQKWVRTNKLWAYPATNEIKNRTGKIGGRDPLGLFTIYITLKSNVHIWDKSTALAGDYVLRRDIAESSETGKEGREEGRQYIRDED